MSAQVGQVLTDEQVRYVFGGNAPTGEADERGRVTASWHDASGKVTVEQRWDGKWVVTGREVRS